MIAKKVKTWAIASLEEKEFTRNLKIACKGVKKALEGTKDSKLLLVVFLQKNASWMRDLLLKHLNSNDDYDIMLNYVDYGSDFMPFIMTLVAAPGVIELEVFTSMISVNVPLLFDFLCDGYPPDEPVRIAFTKIAAALGVKYCRCEHDHPVRKSSQRFSDN